jgi:undecaprenyl-diphosphatase
MDILITCWINSWAGSGDMLDKVTILVTQFGVPLLVLFVVFQWWSVRDRVHVRHACIAAGLSFVLGLGMNQIIILFFQRVRPYDAGVTHLIIDRSVDASFPSDHATACFAIAATLLIQGLKWRGAAAAVAALLISVSRVYVGTHYVTDLLGGVVMAVVATILVHALYRKGTRVDRLVTEIL